MSVSIRAAALAAALMLAGVAAASPNAPGSTDEIVVAQGMMGGGGMGGGMRGGMMHGGMMGSGMMGGGMGGLRGGHPQETVHRNFKHGCHAVCSGFGSHTRCDGSRRSPRFPTHRGVDVAVPVGTPIIAIADGVVVKSGQGPSIGGIGLVIRHPPEATGLSTYTYSFYKHLREVAPESKGTQVHKGQTVAYTGKSGTEGSIHFGSEGFAELHVEIWDDAGANWPSGHLTDPVTFLRRTAGHTGWFCR
jgi:murein DD-endopeptidase MepM/ murein hydrolase activator NlpD